MQTRYLRGSTAALNRLNLPSGSTAVDIERKALRFYDGETQGGYELLGRRDFLPPLGPGPDTPIAGSDGVVFLGEVTASELISGTDLALMLGLSAGVDQSEGVPWLKYLVGDRVLFVAKRAFRHSISHDHISAVNAVTGDQTVSIEPYLFRIRLLTGLDVSGEYTAGGEWDRLMYPIHVDDPLQQGWGIGYTDADLGVASGNGHTSWTQETEPTDTTRRVRRGQNTVSGLVSSAASNSHSNQGWRPVLELTTTAELSFPVTATHHANDLTQFVYPYDYDWSDVPQ